MNSVKIFEALGEVDDELVERADRPLPHQNRHEIVKRMLVIAACLALVVSLSIGGAMMMRDANKFPEDKPQEAPQDPPKQSDIDLGSSDYSLHFSTLDEFENYISDKENQRPYYKVDNEAYIDFNSIVPNSEIVNIHIMGNNYYLYRYYAENQTDIYTGFGIQVNKEEDNRTQIERGINNGVFNETPYCSIDELREITPTDRQYTYSKIGNHTLLWYDSNIDESDDFSGLGLYVGDYCITFFWEADYTKDDYTPTQYEFLSTIVPAYGATDESIIEMLDKIKALIPQ